MNLIVVLTTFIILAEVGLNAKKLPLKDKRQGFLNLGATAYPTIPPIINQLTSNLFQKSNVTGVSPIYQFLSSLTSQIYPAIANATYSIFMSLNPLLNGISSNLYTGLCSPPSPTTNLFPFPNLNFSLTGGLGNPLSLLPLLLGGLSSSSPTPTSNPIASILGPLASLIPGIGTTNGNNPLTNILGPLASLIPGIGASNGSNLLTSILGPLASLIPGLTGPTSTPGGTGSLGSALPLILSTLSGNLPNLFNPLSFLNGVTGPNGINGTLGLSPTAFLQLLASLGYNAQSLQQALRTLNMSAQDFVNGFTGSQTALQYLISIFARAPQPTTSTPGNNSGSGSFLGSLNPLLTGLGQLLASLG